MAKTYPLKALWPLLPFEVAPAPMQATLDAYGADWSSTLSAQMGFGFTHWPTRSLRVNLKT